MLSEIAKIRRKKSTIPAREIQKVEDTPTPFCLFQDTPYSIENDTPYTIGFPDPSPKNREDGIIEVIPQIHSRYYHQN